MWLVGLLVSCQTVVAPGPSAYAPTDTPAVTPRQGPTSPVATTVPGTWSHPSDLPTGRSEAAFAVFDGRIFVLGGIGGMKAADRYDPRTKLWDKLPDLPIAVQGAMAASIEEGIDAGVFIFGGFVDGRPSKRVFYLPRDDFPWRELNPMPDPRIAGAAVTIGTKIYIVGGIGAQVVNDQPQPVMALSTYVYDLNGPIGNPWSVRAAIPTGRDHLAAAAIGGKVCAFGGRELVIARNSAAAECYDVTADKWEQLPPLPQPRSACGAAVVGDRVVIAGGEEVQGVIGTVEVFDPKARTYSRAPNLPTARQDPGVVAFENVVYVIGGGGPIAQNKQMAVIEALTLR